MVPLIGTSILRSVTQLSDRKFRSVVALGIGVTLLAFILLFFALKWGLAWAIGEGLSLPWVEYAISGQALSFWGSLAVIAGLSIFLMVPLAQAVQSFFLDDIAAAVEDRYYPHLPPARGVPLRDAVLDGIQAFGVFIIANLLALVIYLTFLPLSPVIFYGLNGYLLGREYFQLAAIRRVGRQQAAKLRKRHVAVIWLMGILILVPLTIPVVNLVVPVLGAACFTHLFHGLTRPA